MIGSLDMIQHFQLILKMMNAKRVIEVGTFTGYTSMSLAQVLPDDGELFTFDIDHSQTAFNIWKEANVAHKVNYIADLNSLQT